MGEWLPVKTVGARWALSLSLTGPPMDVYGLIGNPVGHSVSPSMQEAAFEAHGIDARYVTLEARPAELETAIQGAEALGIAGLNVTVPFKQRVLEFIDPDERVKSLGAVNTVNFTDDGGVTGHNTDVEGVRRAFTHHDVSISGREAVVIGAGGAGRAAAWALTEDGARVSIANRTVSRAEALADTVDGSGHSLEQAPSLIEDATLLVNATTVGMEEDRSPVPPEALHEDLVVLDAVYQPTETRLLRDAAATGALTIDGAWMLLYQGAAAFELWTDLEAPIEAMNDALRANL